LPPQAELPGARFVGVEIGPAIIRAGVFGPDGKLVGKTKLSTKLERGPDAVLARVQRCVTYAADECDLGPGAIAGIGIGLPGRVANGVVHVSSSLGWQELAVQEVLEKQLSLPVSVANVYNLAAWAVATLEFPAVARPLVVLFPGTEIGGAVLLEHGWAALDATASETTSLGLPSENVLHIMPASEFRLFRGRDFRKAIRAGSSAARDFFLEAVNIAVDAGERLCDRFHAESLVLAGGPMEELRDDVAQRAQARLSAGVVSSVLVSTLGELASLAGAGLAANPAGKVPGTK
jgi:predicted NBD/HSP70 family sugar kinase